MKRLPLLVACVLSLLACNGASPGKEERLAGTTNQVPKYHLDVIFDGLIAFVEKKDVTGQKVVWALLVDANYDPRVPANVDPKSVPPCAKTEDPSLEEFPPHVAALRIKEADVALNNVPLGGTVPLFFLEGLDLQFGTGMQNPTIDLGSLVFRDTFEAVLGPASDNYKDHDKIHPDFLKSWTNPPPEHLAARVLIDFGKTVKAEPLKCNGVTKPYKMTAGVEQLCEGNAVTLGESVKVSQDDLDKPVTITLDAQRQLTVKPKNGGSKLEIEILNVLPAVLADFHYDPCSTEHIHPAAFRWYYYLLANQPTPAPDCSRHFYPCDSSGGGTGGTKCPQMRMQE